MKEYKVVTSPPVHQSIIDTYHYIAADSPANALAWLTGLDSAIDSLATMPERCHAILEQVGDGIIYRQLLFKSHRIIFDVVESDAVVRIHALRHAAQDEWQGSANSPLKEPDSL